MFHQYLLAWITHKNATQAKQKIQQPTERRNYNHIMWGIVVVENRKMYVANALVQGRRERIRETKKFCNKTKKNKRMLQ